jgi:hypothetical protein
LFVGPKKPVWVLSADPSVTSPRCSGWTTAAAPLLGRGVRVVLEVDRFDVGQHVGRDALVPDRDEARCSARGLRATVVPQRGYGLVVVEALGFHGKDKHSGSNSTASSVGMARRILAGNDIARLVLACVLGALGVVTANEVMGSMAHIDWIKRRASRLGRAETKPQAWYYRLPWVLVTAAAMVLLIYAIALGGVLMFLYRHLVEVPLERLVVRRR